MPSTPTEALLDVNVIIASIFADHPMHAKARAFVQTLVRFFSTPTTQGGFLRFATRPWKNPQGQEQPPRLSMMAAHNSLLEFTRARGHAFLPDNVPFTDVAPRLMQGHRQWTDAYLLCLARKRQLRFASLESRMSNLDDSNAPILFVVA